MKQAIIIIGGYNSLWPSYLRMARDLEDLSDLQAIGVPLMPWHWWVANRDNSASIMLQKLQETVRWAQRRFQASQFILVGHSAGGVIARLYLHDGPVWGHAYSGADHVHTLITLGSPHCSDRGADTGWILTDEANRLVPGTPYAGRVRYCAVIGRCLKGSEAGSYTERRAFRAYRFFAGQGDVWGDGLVPVQSAQLDGAETHLLEGVAHSRKISPNWYAGSKTIARMWWPSAESSGGPDAC
jgi:pimeloyl-ACP methyl ester carboxylesterase